MNQKMTLKLVENAIRAYDNNIAYIEIDKINESANDSAKAIALAYVFTCLAEAYEPGRFSRIGQSMELPLKNALSRSGVVDNKRVLDQFTKNVHELLGHASVVNRR